MRALALFALLALTIGPAAAYEPTGNAIADTLLRSVERAGFADARVASAERDGTTLVLTGLEGGTDTDKRVRIARTTITDPLVNANNDLVASAIAYESIAMTDAAGEPTATIALVRLTSVRLPGAAGTVPTDTSDFLGEFDSIDVEGLIARSPEGEEIGFDALSATFATRDDGTAAGEFALEGLVFALDLFEEPTAGEIRALGYNALTVSIEGAGTWRRDSGRAVLDNARLSIAGMGAVEIAGAANGLTQPTLEALQAGGLDFARLLEVLSSVSLTGLTVALEDGGLTDRLIGTLAGELDRAQVVSRLTDALAVPLAQLGDPAFAQSALVAARGFLTEPGRLTVAAKPTAEVSALQVIGAAMLNPQLLPTMLSITVTHE